MLNVIEQEKITKGFANHYRIEILELLDRSPKATLEDIVNALRGNYKTLSVHTRKLHRAGLVDKKYLANSILHTLTKRGKTILIFLRKLE